MALRRLAMLRSAAGNSVCIALLLVRWTHCIAQPLRLDSVLGNTVASPQFVLPESNRSSDTNGFGYPCLLFGGGSMTAVPRKKGVCGRVKLPHFFCCSGGRGTPSEQNGTTS